MGSSATMSPRWPSGSSASPTWTARLIRRDVLDRFSVERMTDGYLAVYRDMIERHGRPASRARLHSMESLAAG